jgi:hypothetical protein
VQLFLKCGIRQILHPEKVGAKALTVVSAEKVEVEVPLAYQDLVQEVAAVKLMDIDCILQT